MAAPRPILVKLRNQMSNIDEDLYIFGYGSLTWLPSEDLAKTEVSQGILNDPSFVRVWGQYSTDHRGDETTFGCVCNLLRTEELTTYFEAQTSYPPPAPPKAVPYQGASSGVLGSLYLLPAATKAKTLADLDVREKGGYEREIVSVLKIDPTDASKPLTPVSALLYRGSTTPDEVTRSRVGNFWARILYDIDYAVHTFSASVGPSGWNGDYILNLDTWLESMYTKYAHIPNLPSDSATRLLSERLRLFLLRAKEENIGVLFAYGVGNNEHEQVRSMVRVRGRRDSRHLFSSKSGLTPLRSIQLGIKNPDAASASPPSRPFESDNMDQIIRGLWELALPLPAYLPPVEPVMPYSPSAVPRVQLRSLQCGGSHTVLVTTGNQCYSFGSNAGEDGQEEGCEEEREGVKRR